MTASSHLSSLDRAAITDWNGASTDERTIDVAAWHRPEAPTIRNIRLRFCDGGLADHSSVPESDWAGILPVAVIPPLVNAHTHLEFSTLSEPIGPSSPFPEWIRSVVRWRIDHPDASRAGMRSGLRECRNRCIAAIGEITTSDDAVRRLQKTSMDVVSFRELIGLLPDRIPDQIAAMNRHLDSRATSHEPGSVRVGISPHAPYSVNPDLFAAAVDTCRAHSVPLAMHLAETTDELELLDTGTGHFAEFLQQIEQWDPQTLPRGSSILRYFEQLAKLPKSLAIHCNYLTDKEIEFLGQHPQIAVVYCPRTHHYFGHQPHPWRRIQAAGGTVVLGTDGRGSNPDLSIWKEVQFLASHTGAAAAAAAAADLVPMVTTMAANALGLECHRDSDTRFHAAVIRLPENVHDRNDSLLSLESQPIARLVSDGQRVTLQLSAAVDERNER